MKKKILYVVNPHSGTGRKKVIENEIRERTDKNEVEFEIVHTTHRGHAEELARANRNDLDVVVAVGGDGTVNEVGRGLIGGKASLGIIPCGSGNGLARELEIPLRTSSAIDVINDCETRMIDVLNVGENISLNVAGVGFDAYIGHLFADRKRRGPLQYVNLIAKEYPKYEPLEYTLNIDTHIYRRKAFLICFANSSQWGNDIHIAPGANINDGLMDVCIVSEFPNMAVPALVISLLAQSIDTNKYDEMIRAREVELMNTEDVLGHVDGEPIVIKPHTKVWISPNALSVVAPSAAYFESQRFNPSKIRDMVVSKGSEIRNTATEIRNTARERAKDSINEIKQILEDL